MGTYRLAILLFFMAGCLFSEDAPVDLRMAADRDLRDRISPFSKAIAQLEAHDFPEEELNAARRRIESILLKRGFTILAGGGGEDVMRFKLKIRMIAVEGRHVAYSELVGSAKVKTLTGKWSGDAEIYSTGDFLESSAGGLSVDEIAGALAGILDRDLKSVGR